MNYKILAISIAVTAGIGTIAYYGTSRGVTRSGAASMHSVSLDASEAPKNHFGFYEALSGPSLPRIEPVRETVVTRDIAEPPPMRSMNIEPADLSAEVGMPKIAYSFAYGFRLPSEAIKPLQERHADMCEARGPRVCRIISMRQSEDEGDYSYGSLRLAVASNQARTFGKELTDASGKVNGELISSSINGEDLSKRIVDTEARLRARTALRDRLLDVLNNRKGTVKELVEAERGVAEVNEEIDQATSWLTEMRSRVNYSQMELTYQSGEVTVGASAGPASGFLNPIREALGSLGPIFGSMIAFVIMLGAMGLPIALLVWGLLRLKRRYGWSLPKPESEAMA